MQPYLVHIRSILSPYPFHVDPSCLCGLEDTQCPDRVVEDDLHEVTENASDEVGDSQEQARKTLKYLKE